MDYNRLEEKIQTSKIKRGKLAQMAGISENTISNILKNESTTIETLEKITRALGLKMTYWWDDITGRAAENKDPMLKEMIQDLLDDKKRLKAQVDELESRLKTY